MDSQPFRSGAKLLPGANWLGSEKAVKPGANWPIELWPIRSLELSLSFPGLFAPGSLIPWNFAPWSEMALELSFR